MLDGSGAVQPERRQGAIQRERALRFGWMGWLRAFIAGVVLALGLARVSPGQRHELPSSHARVRVPSPAPKFKAGLQFRTAPHRWRFTRDRLLMARLSFVSSPGI